MMNLARGVPSGDHSWQSGAAETLPDSTHAPEGANLRMPDSHLASRL